MVNASLRELRKSRGISQTHISKMLGYDYASGYSNIEHGRVRLRLDQAKVIADILGVKLEEIVDAAM